MELSLMWNVIESECKVEECLLSHFMKSEYEGLCAMS